MGQDNLIEISGVSFAYDRRPILTGIDMAIPRGKVVAIMGASGGPLGTARGQYDLRKILVYMNTFTVNKPEVFIGNAQTKFDAQGELTDEPTAKFIADLLVSLQNLKKRVG